MSLKKSMKQKIEERFKQIQTDRIYEERVTKFDERRDLIKNGVDFDNKDEREG